jgi:hypothetical protein
MIEYDNLKDKMMVSITGDDSITTVSATKGGEVIKIEYQYEDQIRGIWVTPMMLYEVFKDKLNPFKLI